MQTLILWTSVVCAIGLLCVGGWAGQTKGTSLDRSAFENFVGTKDTLAKRKVLKSLNQNMFVVN